jgi:hypothetical protein
MEIDYSGLMVAQKERIGPHLMELCKVVKVKAQFRIKMIA